MLYTNGQVPLSVVSVVLGSGYDSKGRYWEHRLTPAMAARWDAAVEYAFRKWGKRMRIRSGANAYRDRAWQVIARADACAAGNCNGASVVGYSSHGGNWQGRDCLAIDVDPNGLTWAQVWEACRAAGFACGLITEKISGIKGGEPWHVIDFNAFGPVPAGNGARPFEEDDMFTDADRAMLADVQKVLSVEGGYRRTHGRILDEGDLGTLMNKLASLQGAPHPTRNDYGRVMDAGDLQQLLNAIAALARPIAPEAATSIEEIAKAVADEIDDRQRERLS